MGSGLVDQRKTAKGRTDGETKKLEGSAEGWLLRCWERRKGSVKEVFK